MYGNHQNNRKSIKLQNYVGAILWLYQWRDMVHLYIFYSFKVIFIFIVDNLNLVNIRKSPSLLSGQQNAKQCKLFNIGKFVICQINTNDQFTDKRIQTKVNNDEVIVETDWYILWAEGSNINVKK